MRLKSLGWWLGCGMLSLAYGQAARAAPATGTASTWLSHVYAALKTGQPDPKPEDAAACTMQMAAPDSRYLGVQVTTRYWIVAGSPIMSASSSLQSPHSAQAIGYTIALAPLGLANQYAFGAFRPKALPDTYVLFAISPNFKSATSMVLVLNHDKDYNCLLTNIQAPFDHALSARLATGQK
jgi:hypothetical protein